MSVPSNSRFALSDSELWQQFHDVLDAGEYKDATAVVERLSALVSEFVAQNPSADHDLIEESDRCLANFDWDGAERALLKRLAQPDNMCYGIGSTHMSLSRLYGLFGRQSDTLEHAGLATKAMREYSVTAMPLVMALLSQAGWCVQFDQIDEARIAVDESYSLLEESPLWNVLRARVHIWRSECALAYGQLGQADHDNELAVELLQPMLALEHAAGVRACLSACWKIRAELNAQRNDLQAAVACWQESVTLDREVIEQFQFVERELCYDLNNLASALAGFSRALISVGRIDEAQAANRERAEIRSRLRLPA